MKNKVRFLIVCLFIISALVAAAACTNSNTGTTTPGEVTTTPPVTSGGTTPSSTTEPTIPVGGTVTTPIGNLNLQDIQGLLQSVKSGEIIVKLDDGTMVKVQVEAAKGDDALKVVGKQVKVSASVDDNGVKKAVEIKDRGVENADVVGAIGTISPTSVVIGGKTFKVTANTMLDSGLAPGVQARAEFVTLPDGTMLASAIEADRDGFRLSGKIESMTEDSITAGGKSFKRNISTDVSQDVKVGTTANIKFEKQVDNSLLATNVEPETSTSVKLDTMRLSGKVGTKDATTIEVAGKTLAIPAGTIVDDTITSGKMAEVEFEIKPDGSLEVKHVGLDDNGLGTEDVSVGGPITTLDNATVVVGGQTFKIGPATRVDSGLAAGVAAKVEFVTLSDGSMLATSIETDVDDTKSTGALTSMTATYVVVGEKTFTINAATRLDNGLATGADVRVEFITLPDGSLLATSIETDIEEAELRGRVAEGELETGDDSGGGGGGGDDGGGSGSGSGSGGGGSGSSGSGSGGGT